MQERVEVGGGAGRRGGPPRLCPSVCTQEGCTNPAVLLPHSPRLSETQAPLDQQNWARPPSQLGGASD